MGPGEALIISNGKLVEHFKWFQLSTKKPPVRLAASLTYIERTRALLREAVQRQMVSDVPVGAFLSGGLDSSSVVAFARELDPHITCYTIETLGTTDDGVVDDLPYAKEVANHLGVKLEVVKIDPFHMLAGLEDMVYQLDEPLADLASLNVFFISRFARSQGIKVLLSGNGGDELFSGYRRHQAIQLDHTLKWMPKIFDRKLFEFFKSCDQRKGLNRKITKFFRGRNLTGDAKLIEFFRWSDRADIKSLFTKDFSAVVENLDPDKEMLDFISSLPSNTSPLHKMLALDQRFFLSDHNLLYTDKMSMAAGVEVRVPFLDLELFKLARSMPSNYKQRGFEGKWALKKAMEPYLPKSVIYRKKSGFGVPLRRWMRNEFRETVSTVLSREKLIGRGIFDVGAVHNLIRSNDRGDLDASYTLLSLICIELCVGVSLMPKIFIIVNC